MSQNYTTEPQSSVNGIAARIVLENSDGPIAAGNSLPTTDAGPTYTTVRGIVGVPFQSADASAGFYAATDQSPAGKHLVITDLIITSDTDLLLTFKDAEEHLIELVRIQAGQTIQLTPRGEMVLGVQTFLVVGSSAAGNFTVNAYYYYRA